ncbi:MAG: carboxypeptidase-like regulatory domain-containing protein [Planctomycetales bacterium]|nr:carboxypeptidase-like regulatory domain-containing protein [Planctomycetales bacterium]
MGLTGARGVIAGAVLGLAAGGAAGFLAGRAATAPPPSPAPADPAPVAPAPAPRPEPPPSPPGPSAAPPADHWIARGAVKRADGTPFSGARVEAARGEESLAEASCDKEGKFLVAVPGAGPVRLIARPRRGSLAEAEVEAKGPDERPAILLALRDSGTLAGEVVDDSGQPVAGATVEVTWRGASGGGGGSQAEPPRTTSEEGTFEVPGVRARDARGTFTVRATHPAHFDGWATIPVDDADRLPDPLECLVTLRQASVLRGTVVREDGTPVPGGYLLARVLTPDGSRDYFRADLRGSTFEVKTAVEGTLVVTPSVEGATGLPVEVGTLALGKVLEQVRVVFRPAPPLARGRIVGPDGLDLSVLPMRLETTTGGKSSVAELVFRGVTPVTGEFAIPREFYDGECPAEAVLAFGVPGFKPLEAKFKIEKDKTADLGELVLERE